MTDLDISIESLAEEGRSLAARMAVLNRVRIGLVRAKREVKKGSRAAGMISALREEVDHALARAVERRELEVKAERMLRGELETLRLHHPGLTPTQRRIALFGALGLTARETADILGMTTRSVETHRYRMKYNPVSKTKRA